ncbi:MAG: AMP-binding protein, partial [Deferribacterales bacterium]|nr:AMP-binding protein [Deferribacterales bacterium]
MNTLNKIKSTNYNILHAFESWVEKIPEAECLFITKNQKTYTYKQLSELVNKVANGFKSIGIQEGDRIAFALTNCAEYCYGFYGTIKSKAIIVPLNPSFKIEEALYIMQSSEAKIVVTNTNLLPLYKNIRNKYKGLKEIIVVDSETSETDPDVISLNDLLRNSSSQIESPNFASDDVFEIMYTSGTTGKPKGVMLTHIGVWSNARVFIEDMELGPGDKLFTVAPLCFAAAQGAAMHNAFTSGAALYLGESWRGAEDILQTIEKYKITYFFGPPTFWVFILNHPKINDYDLSSLRIGFTGAAPLSVETFNQFKNRFGFEIIEGAGMTETSPLYSINPYRGIKKPGSCGLPIPNTKVKIFDYNDNEVPVG